MTSLATLVATAAFVGACRPPVSPPAPPSIQLRIVGREHRWRFEHPGPDGVLDTPDDRVSTGDLHLPADIPVRLELHSDDDLYFFGIPALDAKQIAMPDLTYWLSLGANPAGRFDLLGDLMCGGSYPQMRGQLVIEPWSSYTTWLERQPLLQANASRTYPESQS
ncbi:MAG: hypothetical protein ABI780_05995 [Ardenticatenales bacterium]